MSEQVQATPMLVTMAGTIARRCIDSVDEVNLSSGRIVEEVTAMGQEWFLRVTYITDTPGGGMVRIEGWPKGGEYRMTSLFAAPEVEGEFNLSVPAEWIPRS